MEKPRFSGEMFKTLSIQDLRNCNGLLSAASPNSYLQPNWKTYFSSLLTHFKLPQRRGVRSAPLPRAFIFLGRQKHAQPHHHRLGGTQKIIEHCSRSCFKVQFLQNTGSFLLHSLLHVRFHDSLT